MRSWLKIAEKRLKSELLNTMPVKKRPKTKAEQEQAQKAQEAQEAQAQQQKAQEQKAQEAHDEELSPTTESSRSSGSNETYTKEIERTMLLGEAESRGRIKLWADEAEDSGSNPTYDKSIVRPSSKKQREEDQFEEEPSYLSEEDLPGYLEWSAEAQEIGSEQ